MAPLHTYADAATYFRAYLLKVIGRRLAPEFRADIDLALELLEPF